MGPACASLRFSPLSAVNCRVRPTVKLPLSACQTQLALNGYCLNCRLSIPSAHDPIVFFVPPCCKLIRSTFESPWSRQFAVSISHRLIRYSSTWFNISRYRTHIRSTLGIWRRSNHLLVVTCWLLLCVNCVRISTLRESSSLSSTSNHLLWCCRRILVVLVLSSSLAVNPVCGTPCPRLFCCWIASATCVRLLSLLLSPGPLVSTCRRLRRLGHSRLVLFNLAISVLSTRPDSWSFVRILGQPSSISDVALAAPARMAPS